MALPETMWSLTTAAAVTTSSADVAAAEAAGRYEDPSKKIRKPYTITKSRESWTKHEHDKFLEALQLFVRDWKKIEAFVGSKTVIQIRSHAQKYFLKVQKNGRSEHVPPPRPKRKAAHPYPQKASKNSSLLSQPPTAFQASTCVLDPGYVSRTEPSSVLWNSSTSGTMPSWTHSSHVMKENLGPGVAMVANNCWCNSESPSGAWPACESNYQGNNVLSICGMPDFVQVYNFIGSVFDPSSGDLLQKLKEMDPIDVETVLLLVENLSINLASPDFEDHFKVLASYDISSEEFKSENANNTLEADETGNGSFMEFKSENANNTLEAGDTGIGSFIDISSEEFKSENANNTLEANETGNGSFMEFKSENANNTLEAGETGNGSFMVEVEYSEKFKSEVANNTVEAAETGNGSFMVEVSNDEYTLFL